MRRPQRDVCRIFIAKNNQKLKLKKHADNSTRTYSYLKQKAKLKTAHTHKTSLKSNLMILLYMETISNYVHARAPQPPLDIEFNF